MHVVTKVVTPGPFLKKKRNAFALRNKEDRRRRYGPKLQEQEKELSCMVFQLGHPMQPLGNQV